MEIIVDNFRIKKSDGINKFDLYKQHKIQTGKMKGQISEVAEAYGISFKRALEIICHEVTFSTDGLLSIDEYLSRYSEITDKIITKINASI